MIITTLREITGLKARALVGPVVAGTVTLLSALTLTIVSAWLITRSWQMPPVMDITVAVTAVRALGISRSAFRYLDRVLSHNVAFRAASNARANMWTRVARSRSGTLSTWSRGNVLTRLGDDVDAIADVIVRALVPICVAALTSFFAVMFTALLSPGAAIALATGLLFAGVAAPWIVYRGTMKANALHAAALDEHATAVDRVLTDAPSLRVHNQLDTALARTQKSTLALAHATKAAAPHDGASHALSTAASAFTAIATIVVALWTYTAADHTPLHTPEWLAVIVLVPLAAFEAVSVLPSAAIALARAHDALTRLSDVCGLDTETPLSDDQTPQHYAVDVDHELRPRLRALSLVTGYDRDLQTWNADVPFGARREIIAPSGAGKTTLLKTLAGLVPPRSGTVHITDADGHELTSSPGTPALFVAEDEHIFATTIRDNLAIGNPYATDADMIAILTELGLGDWLTALPEGLSTVLAAGDDSVSGGQRRRLIVARALLTHAPILLLDEPTEHLDTHSDDVLQKLLHDETLPGIRAERTVIVVRHPR
ncbi:thiol reductant ABC exporter subunit CydC [Corynebacterium sp. H78]|uniref:thiol reductant ABC exporter subunit CydC n=1 Tax=Corynebacterium sp. H78 TaxID=3133417 RepID=UPI0030A2A1E0